MSATPGSRPSRSVHELEEIVVDTRPISRLLLSASIRPFILIAGAVAFAYLMQAAPPHGLSVAAERALAVFALAVFYWMTGPLPLMVTSLLVIALLGISGVMPARDAFAQLGNEAVFFLLAAFILAAAVNRRRLGSRIALKVFARFGRTPRGLVRSIYLLSAFMSFVIPEHAVAAIVFPIVLDLAAAMELKAGSRSASALFLAMAWGVNIGGIATLLGGGRAILALGMMTQATGQTISFGRWSLATLPLVFALLAIGHVVLLRFFPFDPASTQRSIDEIRTRAQALGRVSFAEQGVAAILALTVAGWLFLGPRLGLAGIAIMSVTALFAFGLLSWQEVEEYVNWGIILMYGGAIAVGAGLAKTGAASFLAGSTVGLAQSPVAMFAILTFGALLIGEWLSHSAVVACLLPVALGLALRHPIDPRAITLAVALPSGLTFILPVGTPANALAYSGGYLRTRDLLAPGLILHFFAWVGLNLSIHYYWPLILG